MTAIEGEILAALTKILEELKRNNETLVEAVNHLVREEEKRSERILSVLERLERGVTGL